MSSFIHKKLSSNKSLPEILKEERLKRNLTLDKISSKTQISVDYLKGIEAGDYQLLPGEVYVKQFIKRLAKFFHFSEKTLLAIYQQEKNQQLSFLNNKRSPKKTTNYNNFLSPKFIRRFFICLIIFGLLGYLGLEVNNIFTSPFLQIDSPASQSITKNSTINIVGKTEAEVTVLINQQEILTRPDGSFLQEVDLNIGLNLFEISVAKKHGQAKMVTISILREPNTASENQNN